MTLGCRKLIPNSDLRIPWIGFQRTSAFGVALSGESKLFLLPRVKLGNPSKHNLDPKLALRFRYSIEFCHAETSSDFFDPTPYGTEAENSNLVASVDMHKLPVRR